MVYIVKEEYIGAAYGVITACMNIGFAVFPLITAFIYQQNGNSYLAEAGPPLALTGTGLAGAGVRRWCWAQ